LAAGSSAVVVVRPERVRIERLTGAIAQSADNLATGTLTDIIYLGNARRYIVLLTSGQEVSITHRSQSLHQSHRRRLEELDGKWNRGEYPNRNIADAEFHRKASKKHAR
jgi:TOBE domain-containing protein